MLFLACRVSEEQQGQGQLQRQLEMSAQDLGLDWLRWSTWGESGRHTGVAQRVTKSQRVLLPVHFSTNRSLLPYFLIQALGCPIWKLHFPVSLARWLSSSQWDASKTEEVFLKRRGVTFSSPFLLFSSCWLESRCDGWYRSSNLELWSDSASHTWWDHNIEGVPSLHCGASHHP